MPGLQPKQGFEIPVDHWLRTSLRDQVEELVLSPGSRISEFVDQATATALYRDHLRKTGRRGNVLWSLLILGRWLEEY